GTFLKGTDEQRLEVCLRATLYRANTEIAGSVERIVMKEGIRIQEIVVGVDLVSARDK
ncbi:unnamed protein product, partial [marine sediment metagenome]